MPLEAPARARSTLFCILALWVIFYASFTLFTPPLLDDADSVHVEVAREMLLRHDYVTLYANGIRYLEKAPLLYWSMALSFKLFGVSAASSRVPLALTMLALALTVEAFARRVFQSIRAGLYAALILLSSFGFFIYTRINLPDAMVCLWLTLAVYFFWLTESQARPSRYLCWAFAVCGALNVLTKGLIGIVFPFAVVIAHLLLTRGLHSAINRIRQLHPATSIAVFLAIAAPWHILIALANPTQGHPGNLTFSHGHFSVPLPTDGNVHGWLWFYFVNEHLLRYLNLRVPHDYDTVPLWLFWGLCLVWLMPWSAYLLHAVAAALPLQSSEWRKALRAKTLSARQNALLLLVIVAMLPMIFFSLSTRQEYYALPALPALIVLIAGWAASGSTWNNTAEFKQRTQGSRGLHCVISGSNPELVAVCRAGSAATRIAGMLLIFGSLAAATCLFFVLHGDRSRPDTDLATLLQQNPGDYALSLGHFLDLNAGAMGAFRFPLLLAAFALSVGTLANFILRRRQRPHAATISLAAGAFLFLLAAHVALQTFAPVLSSQQLAASIAPQVHRADLIVIHQEYEFGSTLGFYLKRNDLHILDGRSSNLWYGSFFPDAPRIFEAPQSLAEKWRSSRRIFLWQDVANQPSPLPPLPGPVYIVAKSGGKEIVSNQP